MPLLPLPPKKKDNKNVFKNYHLQPQTERPDFVYIMINVYDTRYDIEKQFRF